MPNAVIHPSAQELTAFALGKLPETAATAVAGHLEKCPSCRQAVESLPADSFVGKVRAAKPSVSSLPARAGGVPNVPAIVNAPAIPPKDLPPDLARYAKYRFVRELGRGGMGVVYQAEQTVMGRTVAVKVINPSVLAHPDALPRFQGEVKAAAKLDHPNIVRAHDAEQVGSMHLLVMEYVEGTSLAELVAKKGPQPIAYACHYIRQAALGLQHAFEQGMVHRDIKPQNLMVNARGQVKVLDFGLARMRSERTQGGGLTQADAFMGTPEYVAPEQATDARSADTRADIYSLGCTLFFLLAGRPPFQGDTAVKLIMAHIEKEAPALHEVRADVPAELSAVVARMLAKDPARRFQTPVEVAQALAAFVKAGTKGAAGVSSPSSGVSSPGTGTVIAADTSKIKEILHDVPRKTAAKAAPPAQEAATSAFAGLGEGVAAAKKKAKPAPKAAKPAPRTWYGRWPVLAGVGAAVLALGLGAWLLSGIIFKTKVKTADGEAYVVLENLPADAEVLVDGGTVTVKWGDGKKAEVRVAAGKKHRIQVKKEGFQVFGEEVEVDAGGSKPLLVRLVPDLPTRPPDQERRAAEWVLSLGGAVRVRVRGEEKEIDAAGKLPAESFELLVIKLHKPPPVGDAGLGRLEGLTNLTGLYLTGQDISDAGLVHLKGLTNLRGLGLFSNPRVTDAGLAQLANLTYLADLDLNGTGITDAGLVHLQRMTNLTVLNFMGARVTGSGFVHLKGLTKLRVFFLAGSTVEDAGLAHLAGLKELVHFGLERTHVSDAGLVHLKELPNLVILDLSDLNAISDAGLLQLHGLKHLRDLNLMKTKVTSEGVAALRKALPACRVRADTGTDKPAESKADYDAFATGRWVPILTGPGEKVVSKGAAFKDGVLELRDGMAIDKSVQAKDMIMRAKVRKLAGRNIAFLLRQNPPDRMNGSRYSALCFGTDRRLFGVGKADDKGWTNIACQEYQPVAVKDGELFEMAFAVVGDTLTVYVSGKRILVARDPNALSGPGAPGIAAEWCAGLFKDIEVQSLDPAPVSVPPADAGFVPLFNAKDLTGWKTHPDDKAKWEVKDGILIGSGGPGHLFSERGDYENFHFRVEAMINDGGNSGQYFRSELAPRFPKGYEAQINSTHGDPIKTGSLYPSFSPSIEDRDKLIIKEMLVQPNEWFTQEVIAQGNHIVIKVNGKTTVDYVDPKNTFKRGHFALQQHDPACAVKFRKIEVKELPAARSETDAFQPGTVWKGTGDQVIDGKTLPPRPIMLTVLSREGKTFSARQEYDKVVREIHGTIERGVVRWLRKDVRVLQGEGPGYDHEGKLSGNDLELLTEGAFPDGRPFRVVIKLHLQKSQELTDEQGFVPLFNGKDTKGWKTHPKQRGNWHVEKGVLIGSGPATSHLYSSRGNYKNFHLRVEARINDGGNSGLYFRAAFGPILPPNNPRFLQGYEAQINATHGDPKKTGSLIGLVNVAQAPHKPNEWFTEEVIAQGNHLVINVNGKTTADYTDDKRLYTSGHIALQQLDAGTVVEFRKIEIKELPAKTP
jgi:serine/threonine protein kinase